MKKTFIFLIISSIFICNSNAQKSLIDSSFGKNGTSFFDVPGEIFNSGVCLEELKDNRTAMIYLTRNLGGDLDTLNIFFADDKGNVISNGKEDSRALALPLADYGFKNSYLSAVNEQPDGKILIAGRDIYSSTINYAFVVRCMPDGTVDKSFGENGITKQVFYGEIQNGYGLSILLGNSIQADSKGRIVLSVLYYCECSNDTLMLLRFLSNGQPDNEFGENGIASVYSGKGYYSGSINQFVISGDDKIITCGSDGVYPPEHKNNFVVKRFNTDGSIDSSFGENGKCFNYFNIKYPNYASFVRLNKEGKIIIGGFYTINDFRSYHDMGLVSINADGTPDNSFGNGSRVAIDYPGKSFGWNGYPLWQDMEIQENNKIVLGSTLTEIKLNPEQWDGIVYRFNEDGSSDKEFTDSSFYIFNLKGIVDTNSTQTNITQLELKRDGDILIFGSFYSTNKEMPFGYSYMQRLNGDYVKLAPVARIRKWVRHHILHFEDTNPLTITAYYSIEQKQDNGYKEIARLQPKADSQYSFALPTSSTEENYRISAVQKDGSKAASAMITDAASIKESSLHIWPNPAKNLINIETNFSIKEIKISNMQSLSLLTVKGNGLQKQYLQTDLLKEGLYYVEVKGLNGEQQVTKFMKE